MLLTDVLTMLIYCCCCCGCSVQAAGAEPDGRATLRLERMLSPVESSTWWWGRVVVLASLDLMSWILGVVG